MVAAEKTQNPANGVKSEASTSSSFDIISVIFAAA